MAFNRPVLKEIQPGERRVAMTPSVATRVRQLGAGLSLEADAGIAATFADSAYGDIHIEKDVGKLAASADVMLAVQPPSVEAISALKPGAILISFLPDPTNPELPRALREGRIANFGMDQIPRISRAQAMDALSSQAALVGYYAPLLGAVHMPRIVPMMTTAVGSLRAAKVRGMGLGVAGLQAIATAHRLGAITEGYDVRPEAREQALSLGAKFVDMGGRRARSGWLCT
ncbi:hypothetical protein [Burkholderia catarinensis]|uniref:hypothetical protein n=1 Tax=Burkholderia catarinensis TaxID=1108140 RepID=UPI001FE2B01B|nr:hypothetical protein [Burkholderia catarinensis]